VWQLSTGFEAYVWGSEFRVEPWTIVPIWGHRLPPRPRRSAPRQTPVLAPPTCRAAQPPPRLSHPPKGPPSPPNLGETCRPEVSLGVVDVNGVVGDVQVAGNDLGG
jgi:hypothetical protein